MRRVSVAGAIALCLTAAMVCHAATYNYNTADSSRGPSAWSRIVDTDGSTPNAACASTGQSPVSISYREAFGRDGNLRAPEVVENVAQTLTLVNDGSVFSITGFDSVADRRTTLRDPGDANNGALYALSHIDVHTPAEHSFAQAHHDGELQLHFMRVSERGITYDASTPAGIVVDVLLTASMFGEHAELRKLTGLVSFPTARSWNVGVANTTRLNQNPSLEASFRVTNLLPARRDFITYDGSVTRPPCTRGMRHVVLLEPVPVSVAQLSFLSSLVFSSVPTVTAIPTATSVIVNGNARPTQSTTSEAMMARLYREVPSPADFTVPSTETGTSSDALMYAIIAIVVSACGIASLALAISGILAMMDRLTDAVTDVHGRRPGGGPGDGLEPGSSMPPAADSSGAQAVAALADMNKSMAVTPRKQQQQQQL